MNGTNFAALTLGPDRRYINTGLKPSPRPALRNLLGEPMRGARYPEQCTTPNNPEFMRLIRKGGLDHIRVTGYFRAVNSLEKVFADIKRYQPEAWKSMATWGVLCARRVRGGRVPSIHSWGCAIDLGFLNTLTNKAELCPLGSERVQLGLLAIYPHFRDHGWYWGGGFSRRDFMHWEASASLIEEWTKQ